MAFVNWNETKWAIANAHTGLKRDEICPGTTLDQHAESLAMFDVRNSAVDNKVWSLLVPIIAKKIKDGIMRPWYGLSEDEIDAFRKLQN